MVDLNYKLSLKGLRDTLELAIMVGKNSDMAIDKPLFTSRLTHMIDVIDEHLYEKRAAEKKPPTMGDRKVKVKAMTGHVSMWMLRDLAAQYGRSIPDMHAVVMGYVYPNPYPERFSYVESYDVEEGKEALGGD